MSERGGGKKSTGKWDGIAGSMGKNMDKEQTAKETVTEGDE